MCSAPPDSKGSEENSTETSEPKASSFGIEASKPSGSETKSTELKSSETKSTESKSGQTLTATFFSIRRKSGILATLNNGAATSGSNSGPTAGGSSGQGPASGKMDVINPAFVFSHFHQQEDLHVRARNVSCQQIIECWKS